jgi:hypothetical protein
MSTLRLLSCCTHFNPSFGQVAADAEAHVAILDQAAANNRATAMEQVAAAAYAYATARAETRALCSAYGAEYMRNPADQSNKKRRLPIQVRWTRPFSLL